MAWIIERLKEASTWAGFAGLAASVGIAEPVYSALSAAGAAIASLIAVIIADKR